MTKISTDTPFSIARKRFLKNKPAVAGAIFLILSFFIAICAYLIIPDKTSHANFQVVELARMPPGTPVKMLLKPSGRMNRDDEGIGKWLWGKEDRYIPIVLSPESDLDFRQDSIFYTGIHGDEEYISLLAFLPDLDFEEAANIQTLAQTGKYYRIRDGEIEYTDSLGNIQRQSIEGLHAQIQSEHIRETTFWLGSDTYGRDLLSRLFLGSRVSLSVGLLSVFISVSIGLILGALAGFFRGWVDQLIMWLVSVIWSIPTLLLAISLSFVLEGGFVQVFMAIGLSMWVEVARIVRGQIFAIREMQYIEATKALGFSVFRAIRVHILPNVVSPVIVIATANFAAAILIEAGLSFLGIGVEAPVPSWGGMIREGYSQIIFNTGVWLAVFPGLAIVLVVISLNLVGFGLRDALDPKMD